MLKERVIHIGFIKKGNKKQYFFLREKEPTLYEWFDESEKSLNISSPTIEEALYKGKKAGFHFVDCGFRYALPERDEHGINALFFQMKESYNTPNGVYFDEILGNNCTVQFASLEALSLKNL